MNRNVIITVVVGLLVAICCLGVGLNVGVNVGTKACALNKPDHQRLEARLLKLEEKVTRLNVRVEERDEGFDKWQRDIEALEKQLDEAKTEEEREAIRSKLADLRAYERWDARNRHWPPGFLWNRSRRPANIQPEGR